MVDDDLSIASRHSGGFGGNRRLMMIAQFYAGQGASLTTRFGEPVHVAGQAGELLVRGGSIWLTRRGDPDDLVLFAGQRLRLRADDDAVFEQWARDQPAMIDWRPVSRAGVPSVLRAALVAGLRFAESSFAALARSAAAGAIRAQGCISGGDSSVCAGAAK